MAAIANGNGRHGVAVHGGAVNVSGVFRANLRAGVIMVGANHSRITGATITGNHYGLLVQNQTGPVVEQVVATQNDVGVRFENASATQIIGGTFTNNTRALTVWYGDTLTIDGATIDGGEVGIWLFQDHGTNITGTSVTGSEVGILANASVSLTVSTLTLRDVGLTGFQLGAVLDFTLTGAIISGSPAGVVITTAENVSLTDTDVTAGETGIAVTDGLTLRLAGVATTGGEHGLRLVNVTDVVIDNSTFTRANISGATLIETDDNAFYYTTFSQVNGTGLSVQVPGDGLYLGGCNFMDSGMGLSLAGGSTLVTQSYFARNNVSLRLRGAGHVVRHSDFNVDNWSVIVAANQSRFEDNSYANAAVAALLVIGDENWFGNETLTGGARGVRQDAGSGNHYYRLAAGGYTIAAFDLTGGAAQLIDSDLNDNSGIGLNVTDATIRGRDTYLLRNHIGISFTGAGNGSELRGFNASASTGTGLTASNTSGFTVRDSWFSRNGGDGVEVGVNASLRLDGCGIHANGRHGVHLNGSLRVVVNGTLSTGHSGYGFLFEDDRLTQLMASRARGNVWGLLLNRSTAATLRDNEIAYNGYQVGLEGLVRDHFFHTMDTSNSVGGKQLLYLVNLTRVEYEATFEPGFMTVVNSLDSRFTGYRVSGDRQGVVAAFNENCTFAEFNITGNYQGVRLTGGENNNVTGGWFEANELGLLAESESHFTLDDNRFHDNLNGTLLSGSSHALLDDNFWSAQVFDGLELRDSPAAVLRDNHLDGAGRYGLRLHRSSNATLENNTITDNRYNVGVWGDPYGDFVSYFAATQVNGLPAVLLIAPRNTTYNASLNPGFVAVVGGWNVTITGLDMAANGQGLLLAYTNRSRVENVIVRDNLYGIHLYRSHNNTLVNITATGNYRGIIIERSIDNLLLDCQVVDNEEGVVLLAAGGNRLEALNGTHNSIGVLIEGYSAVRETELFNDTFAAASLGGDWAAADGVTLNTGHNHGDSYGLEFRGNASATSHNIDIAGREGMYLAFDFQPGGSHDSPEAEDWLQLEYRQANGSWAQLWQRYGDSARWPYYGYEFIELPFPALHATFAFRFQSRGEAGADSFYIDNVRLAQPQVRGNLLLNTSLTNGGEGVVLDDARHNTLRNLTLTWHTAVALDLTGVSRYNLIESSNLNFNRDGASFRELRQLQYPAPVASGVKP